MKKRSDPFGCQRFHSKKGVGKKILWLVLIVLLLSLIYPASSVDPRITEISLSPVEDAYVDSDDPSSNFGTSSYLSVEFWNFTYMPDEYVNSYLKFDVSTISVESVITDATLQLYYWYCYGTPNVGAHHCIDDSWDESTITWDNAPPFMQETADVVKIEGDDQWYTWNVTSLVKSALEDGILTVTMKIEDETGQSSADFDSRENWSNQPKLIIRYTTPISCSASPSVVTLGDTVNVAGRIALPVSDTVQLTYTRPDTSTVVRFLATNSSGYFADAYVPNSAGVWTATAYWGGGEGFDGSNSTDTFIVTANKRDSWAIIIGVKKYAYLEDLRYADKDASEIYDELKEVWPEDHLRLLVNEQATKSDIESAIKDWLAPRETSESVVLFFFSGHGCSGPDVSPLDEADSKDEYICPYNSLTYSYDNDIRDDTLDAWLDLLDSQRVSIFLDSCNSGGFIDKLGGKELPSSIVGDGIAKDLSKGGRVVATASGETESSWEYTALEHGVFAYYILESLENLQLLDDNVNNEISAEEIFDYTEPKVREYTGETQHPQIYDGYAGDLTLITTLTINLDASPVEASVTVDGVSYTPPVSLLCPLYTEHTFKVSREVWPGYGGTRYLFTSWSDGTNSPSRTIIVSEFALTDYTVNYNAQHRLTVSSDYGNPQGGGWYNEGATAVFSVSSPMDHGNDTRHVFTNWSGDVSSTNPSSHVVIDAPKEVNAAWKTQYFLTVNSTYGSPKGSGWYDSGTTASFEVEPLVDFANGSRVIFSRWSGDISSTNRDSTVMVDSPKQVLAQWTTQHYFEVGTDPQGVVSLNGEGWYDKGTVVPVEKAQSIVGAGEGTQYSFKAWKVDGVMHEGDLASVLMDSPHSVVACYGTQYYLTVVSQFGQPEGGGWYDADSEAMFSVQSPQGFIIQRVFVGWSGDSASTSPLATVIMDGPKTVSAVWRDDYTQLYIVLAVVGLIVVLGIVVKKFVIH